MTTPVTIDIEITPDGEIKSTVSGVSGPQCGPLSEFLDKLGEVVEDSPTADFYQTASLGDQVTTGWGD
jgi:hypothetical protein